MKVFEVFERRVKGATQKSSSNGLKMILKAGPMRRVSFAEYLTLPKVLKRTHMWDTLLAYVRVRENWILYDQLMKLDALGTKVFSVLGVPTLESQIGKLSFKVEPAGKLRVFAIVDAITQSALGGVHE